jgi:hypothetical protein
MDATAIWNWVWQHDWQLLLVTSYVIVNVGPRPHPENLTGYKRIFWLVVDRLAWLSAEKVPGDWKWMFTASPLPAGMQVPVPASPPAATDSAAEAVTLPGKNDPPPPPPPAA